MRAVGYARPSNKSVGESNACRLKDKLSWGAKLK